jgi:hypothetical protein
MPSGCGALLADIQGRWKWTQIADVLRKGLPKLNENDNAFTAALEAVPAKEAEGKGETEKGSQPAAQKKKTRTTRHATQTQLEFLVCDAPSAAALEVIPAEDWCRTWAAGRTIMLRRTSKRVKEVVDKMRLPAAVCLSRSFWHDARNGGGATKSQFVLRQLTVATAQCRITTLELPRCGREGEDAERLQKCWRSAQRWRTLISATI